jgi:hypothetical protein
MPNSDCLKVKKKKSKKNRERIYSDQKGIKRKNDQIDTKKHKKSKKDLTKDSVRKIDKADLLHKPTANNSSNPSLKSVEKIGLSSTKSTLKSNPLKQKGSFLNETLKPLKMASTNSNVVGSVKAFGSSSKLKPKASETPTGKPKDSKPKDNAGSVKVNLGNKATITKEGKAPAKKGKAPEFQKKNLNEETIDSSDDDSIKSFLDGSTAIKNPSTKKVPSKSKSKETIESSDDDSVESFLDGSTATNKIKNPITKKVPSKGKSKETIESSDDDSVESFLDGSTATNKVKNPSTKKVPLNVSSKGKLKETIESSDDDSVESFLDEARPRTKPIFKNKSLYNLSTEFIHSSDDESRPMTEAVRKMLTKPTRIYIPTTIQDISKIPTLGLTQTADQKLVEAENNMRSKKRYKSRNEEPPATILYAIDKAEKLGLDKVSSLVTNIKASNLDLNGDFRLASQKNVKDDTKTYNKGEFSIQERKMIDTAIEKYLVTYDIPRTDLPYLTHPNTKQGGTKVANPYKNTEILKSFFSSIQSLSNVNRTQKQVYWFIRIAYNILRPQEGVVGKCYTRWTQEDDRELLQNCLIKGVGNWVEIDHALARIGCKDRFKNLQSRNKGVWTVEEDQCLVKHGREIMERDGIADPRFFNSWTELCGRLDNDGFDGRITTECLFRWLYLGPQLSRKGKGCGLAEYKDLLTKMMTSFKHAADESEVHWKSIVSADDTVSGPALLKRWQQVKSKLAQTHDLSDYTFSGNILLTRMCKIGF